MCLFDCATAADAGWFGFELSINDDTTIVPMTLVTARRVTRDQCCCLHIRYSPSGKNSMIRRAVTALDWYQRLSTVLSAGGGHLFGSPQ